MARINGDDLETMRAAIAPLDTEELRARYRAGDFIRADKVHDLNKRYRWDLLWQAGGSRIIPNDVTDAHIDTALRKIVAPLEG